MASVVEIMNIALTLNGKKNISSLDDNTPEAIACRALWPTIRDSVLRDHPWNCATQRITFNRLLEAPVSGFKYYYQIPGNVLFVYSVDPDQYFEVEAGKILADSDTLTGVVIFSQTDSTKYDPQLSLAYGYLMAGALAPALTSSSSSGESFTRMGNELILKAKSSDALEGKRPDRRNRSWLNAKYGR